MIKKVVSIGLSFLMASGVVCNQPFAVKANEKTLNQLEGVKSVKVDEEQKNVVWVTFTNDTKGKLTFLDNDIFRYNVDPSGKFDEYAEVYEGFPDTAKIQQYPDSSENYKHPNASFSKNAKGGYDIIAGDVTVSFDNTAKMSIKAKDKVVMQEKEALALSKDKTVQTLVKHNDTTIPEQYFGGGTQNGRFVHTGNIINISNESDWVDGGVSSPNPFYYTSNGYGVLRNTYKNGKYDFGSAKNDTVTATHEENEFDAYYFVSEQNDGRAVVQDLLQGYFKVTGNPVLLPQYGFYLGHLNAFNRDAWSKDEKLKKAWTIKGTKPATSEGETTYEAGGTGFEIQANQNAETLNGYGPKVATENVPNGVKYLPEFSARHVIDQYVEYDMPFGYFLPNDGYGAGYGQNGYKVTGGVNEDGSSSDERLAAVAANVANLKDFADYAEKNGIATGLWTQSDLIPDSNPDTPWHLLRDFENEVKAGVTTLKTDVAWVGPGYSFQLSGAKQAYDIVTTMKYDDGRNNTRPNIISLDGWAGSQRFNSVWTGDQFGGNWQYIKFHVPTFIGQGLAGNPNIACDMDGIWGGDPLIATRDYQWKSFAPQMLDMDGWGAYAKKPFTHGDPYTGVSRMYLKMKAMMMPYTYTNAYAAANINTGNNDTGLPMVRAMFLEYPNDPAAYSRDVAQYQYMWGKNILVAPIYKDSDKNDDKDNDVRNGIYLPDENQIWVDFFTGEQYRGGQVLNNFDAPLWKLPVFVKNGSILPLYAEHNNVNSKTEKGLDRTKRLVEFWPAGTTDFTAIEDDGSYVENKVDDSNEEYGKIDNVNYGPHVSTKYTSTVDGTTATLIANKATGSYEGYDKNKDTTFIVHASEAPKGLEAYNGDAKLNEVKATSKEEFKKAKAEEGTFVTYYDETPEIETFASAEEKEIAKLVKDVKVSGKLYVKFANTDSQANAQKLVVKGFKNEGKFNKNELNKNLKAPTGLRVNDELTTPESIRIEWDANKDATSYDVLADGKIENGKVVKGLINSVTGGVTSYEDDNLPYESSHTYYVRSVNADGYSAWSEVLNAKTKTDPFLNTPDPVKVDWNGDVIEEKGPELAFDKIFQQNGFRSTNSGMNYKLTVDYGKAYLFDKIEYYPPLAAAHGTIEDMMVETSLDGVHWIQHGDSTDASGNKFFDWEVNDKVKVMDLSDPAINSKTIGARYIRFTALKSRSGWFAVSELKPYVVSGKETAGSVYKPFKVGNILTKGEDKPTLDTFAQMYQKESSAHKSYKSPQWVGEIQKLYGDINNNGISDVYDYAFTAFDVDGGTKQTGEVEGHAILVPSAKEIKAGETFTIDVNAENIKNLNAYGSIINYNPKKVKYVKVDYTGTDEMYTQGMTGNIVNEDGTAYINHNAINMGDKPLVNGTKVLSTITLQALEDITLNDVIDEKDPNFVMDLSTVTIMGPDFSFINCKQGNKKNIKYGYNDFNITLTNEFLPKDDGTNVNKLIQDGSQEKYETLFNGKGGREFELLYSTNPLPEYVTLPLTMHLNLKENNFVDTVVVKNANKANGYLTSAKAQLVFADGTKSDEVVIDQENEEYVFNFKTNKKVDQIDITFLKAIDNSGAEVKNMLTLSEIEISGHKQDVANKDALTAQIKDAENVLKDADQYTSETVKALTNALKDAKTLLAKEDATQEEVDAMVTTLKEAIQNLEKADQEKPVVNKDALKEEVAKKPAYSQNKYTKESWNAYQVALKNAQAVLKNENATQEDVDKALKQLQAAYKGLVLIEKPEDSSKPVTPQKPNKPEEQSNGNQGNVDTGATTNTALLWTLVLGAGVAVVMLTNKKRKATK